MTENQEQIILDPTDEGQAFQIILQALSSLNGVQMRAVWKAYETIESSYNERQKETEKNQKE